MTEHLRISVIVNTYNRGPHLERLLAGLNQLRYEAFEVVVVNGPSTDGTEALLGRYAGRIKAVTCPVAHMTTSRNLGIAAAAGDVVVFIDDDALPAQPMWLDNIAAAFRADVDGKLGAVGGPVFHHDTPYHQFRRGLTSDYILQVFWGDRPGTPLADGRRWVRRTMGCNSAFRRSALVQVGAFDERIQYYGDEGDVCLRLARAGYGTSQPDDCAVRHYPAHSTHLGAPFMRNRRVIAQDDTYACLKNGLDPLWRRLLKTFWLAPRKQYVREMPEHWWAGRISLARLLWFYLWQWPRGVTAGLLAGLFRPRGTRFLSTPPPAFVRFRKEAPEPRRRVALVTLQVPPDSRVSGVGRYAFDMAKGLHELGHEVHVIAQSEAVLRRESLGLTVHGIPRVEYAAVRLFPGRPVVSKNVAYGLAVARKLQELYTQGVEFDVVETANWDLMGLCMPYLDMYPMVLMLVSPLAEVVDSQGWSYDDDLRLSVALDRWQIEHADLLCVPSLGVMEVYRRKMGLDFDHLPPLRKVLLGAAPTLTRPASGGESGSTRKRLLFVGRLERRKGAHVLLQVLPGLLSEHPDWQCDLVGGFDGPGGEEMRSSFLRKHILAPWRHRVKFHGIVEEPDLHDFYRRCDVFVAPSLFESFGLIYVEAMQYAKPVVGCRAAGIPEVVADGVEGILVEPDDPDSLQCALERLMSDPQLRDRLGRAGLRRVQEELNHVAMARRMVPQYEEVIAAHGVERLRQRRQRMSNAIILLDLDDMKKDDYWSVREPVPGVPYLFTEQPGASLGFEVPGGSSLCIVTLRHRWSGVIAVSSNGHAIRQLDLFHHDLDLERLWELAMPGTSADRIAVRLEVNAERHPASGHSEAWVKRIGYRAESG